MAMSFSAPAKKLDDVDLPRIASMIGCGEDELHAVLEVETSGGAADSHGRLKMLFEPHVFYRNLKGEKRDAAVRAGIAYPNWRSGYPADSYPRLMKALAIDETAALKACSWGLGQILGENHKAAGYATPQAMVHDFTLDEDNHLEAMVRFIKASGLARAIARHDWAAFAAGYNGPKYATHNYHGRLAAAFAKWRKIKDTPWDGSQELALGGAVVDVGSSTVTGAKPVAEATAPLALPLPGAKPSSPKDAKEATIFGVATAGIAAAWQTITGSGLVRVALVLLIVGAFYWFLVRPVLRRMGVLDRFYEQVGEVGLFARVRLAMKGTKQFLWGRLIALVPVAGMVLQFADVVDFTVFWNLLPPLGPLTPAMYGPVIGGAILAYVNNLLRTVNTTPPGATDLNLAPPLAPSIVPDNPDFERRVEAAVELQSRIEKRAGKRKRART